MLYMYYNSHMSLSWKLFSQIILLKTQQSRSLQRDANAAVPLCLMPCIVNFTLKKCCISVKYNQLFACFTQNKAVFAFGCISSELQHFFLKRYFKTQGTITQKRQRGYLCLSCVIGGVRRKVYICAMWRKHRGSDVLFTPRHSFTESVTLGKERP